MSFVLLPVIMKWNILEINIWQQTILPLKIEYNNNSIKIRTSKIGRIRKQFCLNTKVDAWHLAQSTFLHLVIKR